MIPETYRLPLRKMPDFFAQARSVRAGALLAKITPTTADHSRLAVVVSKKTAKRAVDRNYLRRVVLHTLYQQLSVVDTVQDPLLDVAVIVLPDIQNTPNLQQVAQQLYSKLTT